MHEEKIAVIGVGRMGANIARRLSQTGHAIACVFDAHPPSARALSEELGVAHATTLRQATALADVIVTVVSDDAAMERIFAEHGDSLLDGCAGRLFVNCATVAPATHVEIARRARARGALSLEACMAGSIPQAREGTLYLMVAGDAPAFERAKPVLADMGASIRYVGPAGAAARVKALVNMVMNANTAALAEGLGLGEALGLDLPMLREIFSQTGAASRVLVTDGEDMQNRDHEVYFSAEHAAKDSGIALRLADEAGLDLPVARATFEQYRRMVACGLGGLDKSGVAELTFRGRGA